MLNQIGKRAAINTPRTARATLMMLALFCATAQAQGPESAEDSTESLELLMAPATPGFVLLGIEPASVERPGTVADLQFSILTATDNLSVLPENYAVALAPYWLLAGERITYEQYSTSGDVGTNFLQTVSLSVAATGTAETAADTQATSLGVGLQFSLLRGAIDPAFADYAEKLDEIYGILGSISERVNQEFVVRDTTDSVVKTLRAALQQDRENAEIERQLAVRRAELTQQVEAQVRTQMADSLSRLRTAISRLRLRRTGWKLDVAGGLAVDFPGRAFDDGSVGRWGGWLTLGYEGLRWGALSVVRVLSNRATEETSIDVGSRLLADNVGRFSISAEGVFRSFPNTEDVDDTYRLALIVDYAVAKNQALSLTFGRDFEGRRSGNLLAAVNLLLGLGSKRPVR